LIAILCALSISAFIGEALAQSGGSRFSRAVKLIDYLDDRQLFQPAWDALTAALPPRTRLYSVAIEGQRMTLQGSAPATPGKLDEWTVRRARILGLFERDAVSGPSPVPNPPGGPPPSSALFGLEEVALNRLEGLIDEAIARAGLEDPARVTRIDIGRQFLLLPSPRYGVLRIALQVGSGRESATVYARADGTIVAADLSQTNRAARLELLGTDDWPMREAQEALGLLAGDEPTIRRVEVGRKRITLYADNPTNAAAVNGMSWDLSGAMPSPLPSLNTNVRERGYLGFKLSDVDFTKLPEVKRSALQAFGHAVVKIADITAQKPISFRGDSHSEVLWHVSADFPGAPASRFGPFPEFDERGLALVRPDGTVASLRLPKRLRPAVDWISGKGLTLTIAALRDAFGPETRIQSIGLDSSGARIELEDPVAPGTSLALKFDHDGLARDRFGARSRPAHAFALSALDALGSERLGQIAEEAYRRIDIPDERPTAITLYGSAGYRSPAGTPHLEVTINGRRQGYMTYRFASGEYTPVRW
jgi:hypothetical protein